MRSVSRRHDDPGYFGLALTQRNVMAVTGACMLVRRDVFERLGRFDEAHQIVNNDLDFCLRVAQGRAADGVHAVRDADASRTGQPREVEGRVRQLRISTRRGRRPFAAGDPYFNPRLSRHADDYRPDDEAVQWVSPGAPLFHADEIKRILVVKLDHIGDFVTALPAIRRLKQLFPQAQYHACSPVPRRARSCRLEPCIDELHPVRFLPRPLPAGRAQAGATRISWRCPNNCGRIVSIWRSICASIPRRAMC